MKARSPHARTVETWLRTVSKGRRGPDLIASLERAFAALWQRAGVTLGEITLTAVTERVLFDAAATFPAFVAVSVDGGGMHWEPARAHLLSMTDDELRAAARSVLVAWLTVLGNLTSDLMTPALHAALADVALETSTRPGRAWRPRARKDPKS